MKHRNSLSLPGRTLHPKTQTAAPSFYAYKLGDYIPSGNYKHGRLTAAPKSWLDRQVSVTIDTNQKTVAAVINDRGLYI